MKQRSLHRFLLVAGVAAIGLAACGGDDDSTAVSLQTPPASDAAAADTDGAATGESVSGTDDDAAAPAGDTNFSGDADSTYCQALRGEIDAPFDENVMGNVDIFDPDALEQALAEMETNLGAAVDIAPDEIKDDFRVVLEQSLTMLREMSEGGGDLTEFDPSSFETPEFEAAAARIEAYDRDVCGFDAMDFEMPDIDTDIDMDTSGSMPEMPDMSALMDTMLAPLQQQMGLTDDQVSCLSDKLTEAAGAGGDPTAQMAEIANYFGDCGIDLGG